MRPIEPILGPAADDLPGESFRQVAAELEKLPAAVEPARDLWPAVAERLEPRRRQWLPTRRRVAHGVWRQALAAGLGMASGVGLTWLALGGGPAPSAPAAQGIEVRTAAAADLGHVESQFLRAKEELWLVAFQRRDQMSPEAWNAIQQNLQILDAAIVSQRSALSEDPGNPRLQQRLWRNQRLSLDLLQDLAREGTVVRRKDEA